jgi:hypothetical protein
MAAGGVLVTALLAFFMKLIISAVRSKTSSMGVGKKNQLRTSSQ